MQGGDATDGGGGSEVGVVVLDVDVVVGLVRSGQMSRWIWHQPEMGGEGEREVKGLRQEEIGLERERSSWV